MKFCRIFIPLAAAVLFLQGLSINAAPQNEIRGWEHETDLKSLLRKAEDPAKEQIPSEEIYFKDGALYCTGNSAPAETNNRAAQLIVSGNFQKAEEILKAALLKSALFFPFRYNLGVSYLHLNDLKRAELNFTKAKQIVPQYPRTYLELGYINQRRNKYSEAIDCFREAIRRNPKEAESFVMIGDIYFARNQLAMASKYYEASLKVDPLFPNGILGTAKIFFIRRKYLKALNRIKEIDTSGEYDKSYHYYYAECAFKMKDYKTAGFHYRKLLKFRNDRFFLTNSPLLIEHKLYISEQFVQP